MQYEASEFETIIKKHPQEKKSLIPVLQDIQANFNYLPQEALIMISSTLKIPLIDIISLATFYNAFSLTPRGKHIITICLGTACHVREAPKILDEFKRKLDIDVEETTEDNLFTLETVNCLGACALGPIVVIDGEYYGQMKIRKVDKLIKKFLKQEDGIDAKTPKQSIKEFYLAGYIEEDKYLKLVDMIDDRNKLSHMYDEEEFKKILKKFSKYLKVFEKVEEVISSRLPRQNEIEEEG